MKQSVKSFLVLFSIFCVCFSVQAQDKPGYVEDGKWEIGSPEDLPTIDELCDSAYYSALKKAQARCAPLVAQLHTCFYSGRKIPGPNGLVAVSCDAECRVRCVTPSSARSH